MKKTICSLAPRSGERVRVRGAFETHGFQPRPLTPALSPTLWGRGSALVGALFFISIAAAPQKKMDDTPVMSWDEVQNLPMPAAGRRIAYGPELQQFGELRLPKGKGPFAVVVLVHGGCWLDAYDYSYITRLADRIAQLGAATWTIEYRRLGDPGGGWPGTFLDVAKATDHLRELLRDYPLDLARVVTVGHSAGGQLALWLAARGKLPKDSALYTPRPLRIKGVIGLAAITDLHSYRVGAPGSCNASVDRLLGGTPQQQPRRYAETSPLALLPLTVPQWFIQGGRDPIVPAASVRKYVEAARKKRERVKLLVQPAAGHFETAVPDSVTWADLKAALTEALN